jgi:hypothetical protein
VSGLWDEGDGTVGHPLYRLKTSVKRIGEVLAALVEGLDVSAAVRVFGHGEGTIRPWLTRTGLHAERVHEHFFRELVLEHLQLDELRTKVRRKASELWVWVGLDVGTKIFPWWRRRVKREPGVDFTT